MKDLPVYDVRLNFALSVNETQALQYFSDKGSIVSSQSVDGEIALACNGEVMVLCDDGTSFSQSLNLDCSVEVLKWSCDGKYLGVADVAGCIHIISKKDFKSIVCEKVPDDDIKNDPKMRPCFCSITFTSQEGLYTLIASRTNGKIFVLPAVDLSKSKSGKSIRSSVNLKVIDAMAVHEEALCCHTVFNCFYETVMYSSGYGNNCIAEWYINGSCWKKTANDLFEHEVMVKKNDLQVITGCNSFAAFTKVKQVDSFILAICNNGYLYQFSLPHFILVKFSSGFCLLDFIIKMPKSLSTSEGRNTCKVCGIRKNDQTTCLSVWSWETMKEIFSCGSASSFIDAPDNVDDVFFISDISKKDSDISDDGGYEVGIMKLSESSPDARLRILLQHHKYREAAQFAFKYNLDSQPVFQNEAAYLIQMLSSATDENEMKKLFDEFTQCVSKITDAMFIGELCTNCSLSNLSMYYELLKTTRECLDRGGRLYRAFIGDDREDYIGLSLEVDRLLDLFTTFRMTFSTDDAGLWQHFRITSLSEQVASLLASGQLQAAIMICSRHENSLICDLETGGEKQFQSLLQIISDDADVGDLLAWLELIIPAILTSSIANAVKIISEWLYKRVTSMEELSSDWPDDGIKLANVFFKVQRKLSTVGFVRDQLSSTSFIFNNNEEFDRLKLLASRLEILKSLRTRYSCHISLEELIQETTLTLTFRMLDKVTAPELIAKCLENTVRPYMRERKLNEDDTLLLYLKELLGASEKISGQFQSLRQRKVIAIIKCIKDEKVVVESTVLLAKKASIPWSDDMKELVEKALSITDSHVSSQNLMDDEIRSQYDSWKQQLDHCFHLEKIPAIVAKYDIGVVTNSKLVNHEMLVRKIVQHDDSYALDDAQKVAHIFASKPKEIAYMYRLHHLIDERNIEECLRILDELSDIAVALAKRVFFRTIVVLSSTNSMWKQSRLDHCEACIAMMVHVMHNSEKFLASMRQTWIEDLQLVKNIYDLQVRHNELVSVENFEDQAFRHALLSRHVVEYYRSKCSSASVVVQSRIMDSSSSDPAAIETNPQDVSASGDRKNNFGNFSSLVDLARLLEIPRDEMMCEIALKAAKTGQAEAAIEICKDLCQVNPSNKIIKVLEEIALTLLRQLENNPKTICLYIDDICELVAIATVHCKEEKIQDLVTLHNLCRLSRDVVKGTDVSAGDFISKCVESGVNLHKDKYQDISWLNTWYVESDVLTLHSTIVLPLLSQIIQLVFDEKGASLPSVQPCALPDKKLDELISCLLKITSNLQESRQITSSLQWLSAVENLLTAHLSNSKTLSESVSPKCKATMQNISDLAKYAYAKKKAQIETLLEKIFLSRHVDSPYAVALLLVVSDDEAHSLLNSVVEANWRNFSKIMTVSRIALELFHFGGNSSQKSKFESLLLDATWAQRLQSLKVPVDGFLLASKQWKEKCLLTLLENPNVTGNVLIEYCRDFAFDSASALLQYISVLLNGTMFLSSFSNETGGLGVVEYGNSSTLIASTTSRNAATFTSDSSSAEKQNRRPWSKIKDELKWVSRNCNDAPELIKQIERCLVNNMSPYDYEKIDFVLQLLQDISPKDESCSKKIYFYEKARQLLNFLRFVKRDCPPSDVEKSRPWCKDARADRSAAQLPALAQKKLPFHPFIYGDANMAWKVISAEANERNAEYLVPIVNLLRLDADKFFMVATNNTVARLTKNENNAQLTQYQLAKLRELIKKIGDTKKAVAMAKRISEALPSSQEKVDAYEWCLSLIAQWRDSLPKGSSEHELASNAHWTLTQNFKQVSCELVLAKHSCDPPDVLKMINHPENLIIHLYQHPSIFTRFHNPGDSYPNIHELVDEVASIFELDSVVIRLKLIVNLLLAAGKSNSDTEDDDSTVNLERLRSAALAGSSANEAEEAELIRLLYLLTYDDPEQQGKYLIKVIGNHQDRRITNACRVRALQCLLRIINDDQKLFALTNKTAENLRSDLRILIYLTELEEANFNVPASHLRQSDKSSVARSVIASTTCQRNPVALRAAAEMCREFGNASSDMWVLLLQQLVALKQVAYLQQLLPDICRIPSVLSLPCLASVWQTCVTLSIVSLTPPLDETQLHVAISSYHFLIRCPVLLKIDLPAVAKHFHALELPAFALACLLLSPSEVTNARKLALHSLNEIQSQLSELHSFDAHLLGYNMIMATERFSNALFPVQWAECLCMVNSWSCKITAHMLDARHQRDWRTSRLPLRKVVRFLEEI